jgi:pectin methylesterase-like acyl-CoA thioesterase
VGPTGSITGLTPPASVSYGFGTFVFESNVNTPANLDAGSIILRNIVANSHGLTLSPPAAMSADYTLTLPSLPASKEPVTLDTSGNFGTQRQLVWDIVVNSNLGSGGVGDFATIGSALGAATTGQSILVMTGTYTENVTVSKSVSLYGLGVGCIINGTLTIASGANDCLVEGFKVTGNITINSGVSEASLISFWLGSGSTLTNNGSGSFIQGMAE